MKPVYASRRKLSKALITFKRKLFSAVENHFAERKEYIVVFEGHKLSTLLLPNLTLGT